MALYHEKQVAGLCGVHAINTLLQGPIMNEWSLAKIAQDLDALELSLMASQGLDTEDYKRFAAEESGNVAGSGMFSIQVRLIWYVCCVWGQMHTREQFHMLQENI
jgi:Ataxin-3